MTTFELEARKTELIQEILNINNSEILDKVRSELRKWLSVNEKSPCTYTLEEVKQRLTITEADAIAGKGISEEEANAIMDKWV
ncbi:MULTISPECIES: hypothetical protein [Parabacteroides]|jgi:hypothetical protein|uniref:hypothetical protein n=1 Tax=Parabacteroides TaxID=375288 RepID=UPI000F00181A|nr:MULTISPECIES: hypothetical protein [Parabacteroides]RHU25742.1 hypothetical protein DXD68_14345 [Parabacteroides sp. TM07-1AC]WFE85911.1 hypothetical protein P3L47_04740 [Parabacteroides chongii]